MTTSPHALAIDPPFASLSTPSRRCAVNADEAPRTGADKHPLTRLGDLFAKVYAPLKSIAQRELRRSGNPTLNTTALVHELYLKIGNGRDLSFAEAAQFFTYAARAMRHILLDRAYHRVRIKKGGGAVHVDINDPGIDPPSASPMLALQLDAALNALEAADQRAARVVELHYFAGLDLDRVAELLGVSRRTIDRDWRYARAFLFAHVD